MTRQKWAIIHYETSDGQCPVEDFLDSLSNEEFAHMDRKVRRLENYGPELKRPDVGYLRDKIWELRARCFKVRLRILYWRDGCTFILSHGLRKKSGRVPDSEIDRAVEHREDYFAQKGEEVG
jgi:phage-related protein